MKLDKRSHDFLVYTGLKNYIGTGKLQSKDYEWMIEYLEGRLEYYCRDRTGDTTVSTPQNNLYNNNNKNN